MQGIKRILEIAREVDNLNKEITSVEGQIRDVTGDRYVGIGYFVSSITGKDWNVLPTAVIEGMKPVLLQTLNNHLIMLRRRLEGINALGSILDSPSPDDDRAGQ